MKTLGQTLACRQFAERILLLLWAMFIFPELCFGMSGGSAESGSGEHETCASVSDSNIANKLKTLESGYSIDLSNYQCVIVEPDDEVDVSTIINSQGRHSIIVFYQSSLQSSFTAKTIAYLKPDSWLVGVNPVSDEPVTVKLANDFEFNGTHWLEAGVSTFFRDMGNSGIFGLRLIAPADGADRNIDSIIFLQCFNGAFTVADNDFFLDRRSSVYYWCLETSDTNESRFVFQENRVYALNLNPGLGNNPDRNHARSLEGVFVEVPYLQNNPEAVVVSENEFSGNYDAAIKITVGEGSHARITGNRVDLTESGKVQAGIRVHLRGKGEKASYRVDNNDVNAINGLQLYGGMDIEITNNRIAGSLAVQQQKQVLDLNWNIAGSYGLVNIVDGQGNEFADDSSPFSGLIRYQGMLQFNGITMAGDPDYSKGLPLSGNHLINGLILMAVYWLP